MRPTILTMAALAASFPAWAQDKPLIQPSRDVVVEYKTSGMSRMPMGGDGTMRMYFANKGRRMRIEPAGGQGVVIMDTDSARMMVIMLAQKIYMELPQEQALVPMLNATNATFTKIGTDTVAGIPCVIYETSNGDRRGKACLTEDGVLLRGQGNDANGGQTLEATKVTYGAHAASTFEPPAGFRKMEMPGMPAMPTLPGTSPGAGGGLPPIAPAAR